MIVQPRFASADRRTACRALAAASSEAASRVAVAAESRKAAIGVAECYVRIKELESTAGVEQRRLIEVGATERCRITEEQRSRRTERLASVAQTSVTSNGVVAREAVAAGVRIEEHRATMASEAARAAE
eukprot:CAMPEP_0180622006 /NCGR_PEP_ID=MMETSP1037_2-20121125/35453_1 /TAXON_ID=632150 /ORGANISM="Azadinium spinosum, Strain 3D9" /LENGTH=128 /DNA_ID=CAMNT_0022642223 /DNA_START=42 /DNA_END=425 /DNA_ORIENTATION=-